MAEYQPSYVRNTARRAVTSAATMPNDRSGSDAAELAADGALEAPTGAVRKHPATSTTNMSPTLRLMPPVRVLPMRRPPQCRAVNKAIMPMAVALGAAAAAGHSAPRNVAAVNEA